MNLAPVLKQRFFDANNLPLAGGQLFSYAAGTTTPQATYSNATGTANTNPVVLDASGYADVWLDPSLAYKFILQDSSNNVQWTVDNITSTSQGIAGWNANTVYAQGAIVQDASGQGLLYVSLTSNNQNNPLTSVSNWRVFAGNARSVSTNTALTITDDLVRSNSTSGAITHTLPAVSTTPIGKRITIKDVGTGGNATSVKGSGTDLVDGNNTYAITLLQNESIVAMNNGTSWDVLALSRRGAVPTVQKFTSGSGTYTLPTARTPLYIRVRMVGGGGGGSGSGTASGGAGGAGGNTTFGTTLLAATGGGGGAYGGAGGTSGGGSLGTGPIGIAIAGSTGSAGGYYGAGSSTVEGPGGAGGTSALGGAGGAGIGSGGAGNAAITNSGSGGGGGGGGSVNTSTSGSGGGAGGFIDAIIASPAATYAYAVGAAGTAGTAGTSGSAGGAGGSGLIEVTEFYQ